MAFCFISLSGVFAQTTTIISGRITSTENGDAVMSAVIRAYTDTESDLCGTLTDTEGYYSLKTKGVVKKISFSASGYKTVEILVDENMREQTLDVSLEQDAEVIGY